MTLPSGVVGVVRAASTEECRTVVRGLVEAGVPAIEVTMTVPGALQVIEELSQLDFAFGAGTVLDAASCRSCVAAGARFIVAPSTDPSVLDEAHRSGVPYVGGALTPTEVLASMRAGSDAVKIFPIGAVGGPSYLRALLEPFPSLRAVVSGGVGAAEVGSYLAAGAQAVCMGGALVDRPAAKSGDVAAVARHARLVLARLKEEEEAGC